jgi:hypothetical protein
MSFEFVSIVKEEEGEICYEELFSRFYIKVFLDHITQTGMHSNIVQSRRMDRVSKQDK